MKKILIIDNSPDVTGAFKSIFQVTSKLISKFEFIYLIPKDSKNAKQLQESNYKVLEYKFFEISKSVKTLLYIPQLIYNTLKLTSYISKMKVDIVHVNDIYNMIGIMAKLLNPKIELIYHIRLLPNSYAKRLYSIWRKIIEKYADEIICVSESVASNFKEDDITVINDAIGIPNNLPDDNQNPSDSALLILYLANYIPGKGHKRAIEAYEKASHGLSNTKLVFFGGTLSKTKNVRFKTSLIQYAQEQGLSESIIFNGFSSNPEQEIRSADLMLNFSESESFSMTTLEALAYGTPIIATDCGGPAEIIEDGLSGILVPVNNINAMATAIEMLINNKPLRTIFSQNGQKRVKMKFSLQEQTSKLNNLYTRLLN